jgi:uncharacterized protein DUF6932
MALPDFNEQGELPLAIHRASLTEICARFGGETPERQRATNNLRQIHQVATVTGKLQRFIIFGSYVTAKLAPNDVDVILVMCDDFDVDSCDPESKALFDHQIAPVRFGASVFWTRPCSVFGESLESFLASWQIKRDKSRRGIVEVRP